MKKSLKGLRYANTEKVINEYVNNHTFRSLYHKEGLHDMVLRALRNYFDHCYAEILHMSHYEEFHCPNVWKLDDFIKHLKEGCQDNYNGSCLKAKLCRKEAHNWQIQDDLYDCSKPEDLSLITQDVLKYMEIEHSRSRKGQPNIKNIFIPISHVLEYREHWEDLEDEYLNLEYADEYEGYEISSILKVAGAREY